MSAYYLSKRREEEEAQRRAVQEQVAAKNAALRAQEAQMREQAKIQNYLQGKAMLEAALKDSNLSDAEKAAIRAQAQAKGMAAGLNLTAATVAAHQQAKREAGIAWLEQAEETEQDRHAKHINSDEYKAYQAGLLAWHAEQEKKKQIAEALSTTSGKGPGAAMLMPNDELPEIVTEPSQRTIYGPDVITGRDSGGYSLFRENMDNTDPSQYGNLNALIPGFGYSSRHTNLCGQIVVSALTGNPLENVLSDYAKLSIGNNRFGSERLINNSPTKPAEIVDLFQAQGWKAEVKGLAGNYWGNKANASPTLGEVQGILANGQQIIALVKIDGTKEYGPLRPNGTTGHWISVQKVDLPNQKVQIYNPFHDQEQIYTWDSFKTAWQDEGSHTIYNYVAVIASPPMPPITALPATVLPSPTYTPTLPAPTMTPLPRNTPSEVPPQQQTETEEPSLFEKLEQSLKQLWEQISDWLPGGDK